ncbi:hypothetical protein NQ315_000056 [Exocentrus adspersus]|uniref:Uncharacterized protein n=1 Tax=Exocentrus adspersus TaxID=1586481 RepID=A0AAV8VTH8_9CUCU|nr:hypothetical protein NQ315_000056 [Exocentrus adspersus]
MRFDFPRKQKRNIFTSETNTFFLLDFTAACSSGEVMKIPRKQLNLNQFRKLISRGEQTANKKLAVVDKDVILEDLSRMCTRSTIFSFRDQF